MSANKKLIVANWKMNLNIHDASIFVHQLAKSIAVHRDVEVVLAPTMLALQSMSLQVDRRQFKLAAQNFYWRDFGAFTGEVSAAQLRGLVDYAIVGHSERRHVFHEHAKDIRSKVQAALRCDIKPILCIGETAHERSLGETNEIIHDQLISGLANVTSEEFHNVVIAYEPVWAIGTGKTASPEQAQAVHAFLRAQLVAAQSEAARVPLLYGGSVKPDNAAELFAQPDIDGGLIGGASLKAADFVAIARAAV